MNNAPMALTGFAAFCAMVIKDPIISFILMTVILLTCATVMIHIIYSCWQANRKEARRVRVTKKPT